jgi:hypothetical protein
MIFDRRKFIYKNPESRNKAEKPTGSLKNESKDVLDFWKESRVATEKFVKEYKKTEDRLAKTMEQFEKAEAVVTKIHGPNTQEAQRLEVARGQLSAMKNTFGNIKPNEYLRLAESAILSVKLKPFGEKLMADENFTNDKFFTQNQGPGPEIDMLEIFSDLHRIERDAEKILKILELGKSLDTDWGVMDTIDLISRKRTGEALGMLTELKPFAEKLMADENLTGDRALVENRRIQRLEMFSEMHRIENDVEKILKGLEDGKSLTSDWDLENTMEFFSRKGTNIALIGLAVLKENETGLSEDDINILFAAFMNVHYFMIDRWTLCDFMERKEAFIEEAEKRGLDMSYVDNPNVLMALVKHNRMDILEFVESVYSLQDQDPDDVGILLKNVDDPMGAADFVILEESGYCLDEIIRISKLDGSVADLVYYFTVVKERPDLFEDFKKARHWYYIEKNVEKVVSVLDQVKSLPIRDHDLIRSYQSFKRRTDSNLDKYIALLPLAKTGLSFRHIEDISFLKGTPEKMIEYFSKLKESNLFKWDIDMMDWYEVEKDPSKVIDYVSRVKALGIRFSRLNLEDMYQIEPSAEVLEKNAEFIKTLQSKIRLSQAVGKTLKNYKERRKFDKIIGTDYTMPAFTDYTIILIVHSFNQGGEFSPQQFYRLLGESKLPVHESASLWIMAEDKEKAIDLKAWFEKAFKSKGSIPKMNFPSILHFASKYKDMGIISPKNILKHIRISGDPESARDIISFAKKHKFRLSKGRKDELRGLGDAIFKIKNYCQEDPAKLAILKHIFDGTSSLSGFNVTSFLSDPALPMCEEIYRIMSSKSAEDALKIGRNFYFSGIGMEKVKLLTPSMITEAYGDILDLEKKYAKMPTFRSRNVVVVGNSEVWAQNKYGDIPRRALGKPRFITPGLIDGIENAIPLSLETFVPSSETPTARELVKFKEDFLSYLTNTPPPLTAVFPGHGGEKAFYFNNGRISDSGAPEDTNGIEYFSSKEFSDAIIARANKFGAEAVKDDIYILDDCFASNYIRDAITNIEKVEGVPVPILAAPGEYGQYGYSHAGNESKDSLYQVVGVLPPNAGAWDRLFGIVESPTIGDIISNSEGYRTSNFTLIVPNKKGKPAQIVEADKDKRPEERKAA